MVCSQRRVPTSRRTSPGLKTLASGQERGIEKMSPRKRRCSPGRQVELANPCRVLARPAAASAVADAGMTPWLALMATRLAAPPTPMSHSHGTLRLTQKKIPARA
jgi:hypothetical protein